MISGEHSHLESSATATSDMPWPTHTSDAALSACLGYAVQLSERQAPSAPPVSDKNKALLERFLNDASAACDYHLSVV